MIIIYYFAGCILILDIFVLLVLLDKSVSKFDYFLPQVPLVIFWVLCISVIVYISLLEKYAFNEIKNYFRNKKIVKEGDLFEKKNFSKYFKKIMQSKTYII